MLIKIGNPFFPTLFYSIAGNNTIHLGKRDLAQTLV